MRVLVFSQLYNPETATITDLCKELTLKGHEVTVMTGLPNAPVGKIFTGYGFFSKLKEVSDGVDIRRNWLIPRGSGSGLRMALNYLSFVLFCSIGLLRLRNKKYDVILVNQLSPITVALPAILYKAIYGKKIVMWVHDLWPDSVIAAKAMREGIAYNLVGLIVKFIYARIDFFLPQSVAMLETLVERGISRERMKFTPNPIDDIFSAHVLTGDVSENVGSESACKLMFAGAVGAAQDFTTLLNAIKLARTRANISLAIVGDGRALAEATQYARELDLLESVEFLGRHPVESMPEFYAQADFMLVTLLDQPIFSVTVPLKLQTYMAAGKPIICNVRGEAARVVNAAGCGFSVPPEDSTSLADAMVAAARVGSAKKLEMRSAARRYFDEHYSKALIVDSVQDVLLQHIVANEGLVDDTD